MAATGTINARLEEPLKRHGMQVLDRQGISTSEAVRRLFEYLEREQTVPDWMRAEADGAREIDERRARLRSLVGCVSLPAGYDAREDYRASIAQRHAPEGPS